MTELETLFKEQFPEYCVGDKCLSPYFDFFEAGYEKAEEKLKCCANCTHWFQDCKIEDIDEETYLKSNAYCHKWEEKK